MRGTGGSRRSCPEDEARAALKTGNDEEPPHSIVDSDDEEDVPDTPAHLLSGIQARRRKERQEREWVEQQRRPFLEAMAALRAERDRYIEEEMPPMTRNKGSGRMAPPDDESAEDETSGGVHVRVDQEETSGV